MHSGFVWGCIDETLRVCDVVTDTGSWDWSLLETKLPRNVIVRIATIMPLAIEFALDCLAWRWMSKGVFSSAETYSHFMEQRELANYRVLSSVWKRPTP
ncbi:hypothetical protein GOBAR_AA30277 [Gossypium barbadense]|uniref:Reverse transcriptase zinc-binding domain-containing protein n=1 Tax=Gossypium barbadense TaxID=3634 RepID=A0A2P5WH41_GOSBA|nr:hypothetical protein GOBAR_AA30277 [Gossypium barbadense]